MADTQKSVPMWVTGAIVVLFVLSLWALFSARSAGESAANIEETVTTPDMNLILVRGGPDRFEDHFTEAVEDAGDDELDPGALEWITILVRNDGVGDAEDLELQATVASPETVTALADPSGFTDMESEVQDGVLTIELGDVDDEERAVVFLGFDPENLPEEVSDDWASQYLRAVDVLTAHVEGVDEVAAEVYGNGF